MRGHLHTDIITLTVTAVGVFAVAHVLRVAAAKAGTSNMPLLSSVGKGIGGFFTLG